MSQDIKYRLANNPPNVLKDRDALAHIATLEDTIAHLTGLREDDDRGHKLLQAERDTLEARVEGLEYANARWLEKNATLRQQLVDEKAHVKQLETGFDKFQNQLAEEKFSHQTAINELTDIRGRLAEAQKNEQQACHLKSVCTLWNKTDAIAGGKGE